MALYLWGYRQQKKTFCFFNYDLFVDLKRLSYIVFGTTRENRTKRYPLITYKDFHKKPRDRFDKANVILLALIER